MHYSNFAPLDQTVSLVGFGCASVGSRYGRRAALRAMAQAFEHGVNYFDVARAYGYGDAEAIVGDFIRSKRDRVVVASKFGINPPKSSRALRIAKAMARTVLIAAPRLRSIAAPTLGGKFTPHRFAAHEMKVSVETSLRQLRTDRIDVLLIHDFTPQSVEDDDLFNALEVLVSSGKVGCIGATGERAPLLLAAGHRRNLRVLQFRHDLFGPPKPSMNLPDAVATVVHHPFGGEAGVARLRGLVARAARDEAAPATLRDRFRRLPTDESIAALAFSSARRADGASVILTAMFTPRHIEANARASRADPITDAEWGYLQPLMVDGQRHSPSAEGAAN